MPGYKCPHCGGPVSKMMRYGQLSYLCEQAWCGQWAPWEEATPIDAATSGGAERAD